MTTEPLPKYRVPDLTAGDYALVTERLGREPRAVELAMLSLMWSRRYGLTRFGTLSDRPGPIDVGDGLSVTLAIAHADPELEVRQAASAAAGTVVRDVLASGARPVAVLESLRFGDPRDSSRAADLLAGAVEAVRDAGQAVDVPVAGGEIYLEPGYEHGSVVNVVGIGVAPRERSSAAGPATAGDTVVLLCAPAGRDTVDEAEAGSSLPAPAVNLIGCCLDLLDRGLARALWNVGTGGLVAATSEGVSPGGAGVDIDLATVPLHDLELTPSEIVASASQDRMLCIVEPEQLPEVVAACAPWNVPAASIGCISDEPMIRLRQGTTVVGELPVDLLVNHQPSQGAAPEPPSAPIYPKPPMLIPTGWSGGGTLVKMLESANLRSRRPVFEQTGAAVLALPARPAGDGTPADGGPAVAVSITGNGRRVAIDPRAGTAEAVYAGAANLACVGAEPLGMAVCLNFGTPEDPHVVWQISEAKAGLAQASRDLNLPVVSDNVGLCDTRPEGPILPTPVIGIVGTLPGGRRAGRRGFHTPGEKIALIGSFNPLRDGSEIAHLHGHPLAGRIPLKDLATLTQAHATVRAGVRSGRFSSAQPVAEGGLAVALALACISGGNGAVVQLAGFLDVFGEDLGTAFLVTGDAPALDGLDVIGDVAGDHLDIPGFLIVPVSDLATAHGVGLAPLLA